MVINYGGGGIKREGGRRIEVLSLRKGGGGQKRF